MVGFCPISGISVIVDLDPTDTDTEKLDIVNVDALSANIYFPKGKDISLTYLW